MTSPVTNHCRIWWDLTIESRPPFPSNGSKPVASPSYHHRREPSRCCGVAQTNLLWHNNHASKPVRPMAIQNMGRATTRHCPGASEHCANAKVYSQAEKLLLNRAQRDSFPKELRLLKAGKPVQRSSRLLNLSQELDDTRGLIRVGGHLRGSDNFSYMESVHPVVLDPSHPVIRLLIQDFDSCLRHPGPECVFTEIRRIY